MEYALAEAASLRGNEVFGRQLDCWADRLARGAPIADAAREAGLPTLLSGMLAAAHGEGEAARVLRFLASYYEGRFSRAATLVQAGLLPMAALAFGIPVGTIALTIFVPWARLIDGAMQVKGVL